MDGRSGLLPRESFQVPLNFIEQMQPVLDAPEEDVWFDAVARLAGTWGFDRVLLAILPRPGMRLEDAFVRTNYASSWRQTYIDEGFAYIDPTVSHCASRSAPLLWSPGLFSTKPQKSMYEEAQAHGLRAGVTLPIHGPHQEAGMLCFVSDANPTEGFTNQVNHSLPDLALLRDLVLDTSQRHLSAHAQALIPKLTPRERECLKWTALGKSTWEISHILGCSEAVVNFHMKNIRAKFGVNSRRAAAVIATQLGLIDPG
ncbi:LuxR family transcriptional regulator [Paraburkholderia caballeronis]|uniref:Transcriptional regulator, LuxR family n=2 Tax=Paraburkholderia caballeronis TaxID=416943 RepID=A0A1H7P351_9BURK|nr:LuxR family transcriptional regulator [Paraburkholderia caballeronis]PXX01039.1 LuxR family transcriptional regulator [Paraburkholderia caballeronis]RAJ99608.1 LuxR family transcriptional regulator [Paraburkholderia caballeronis]TDV11413.1 LuxR family transcriptional regulator [Paraburkholderia caballeronis]TDV14603.1 LuxR family transcriptional regulator [Paraburkholderia caballeronis]